MELKELEHTIEGILFAAGDPVPMERLATALEQDVETVERVCSSLADEYRYQRRGICLVRTENSWQMCTAPEYAPDIRKTLEHRKPAKLSQTALEVLAIVAYFQPVTRAYIEQIRGVDSSYTVGLLLERQLIEEAGRLAVPGRPMQFRTTHHFLRTFGLTSLDDLPELPSATQEGTQLTLDLESAIAKMQEDEGTQSPGEV
ncbi:SMC-Scp complex subunit ScpB [Pseudoflavonifractor capillosus]|uniref:SMC-Scp complex subunit ScpB n=1 Tax=Pseudoflavonifractor capillosus TaxID=106588 RepID=UPI00195989CB|nr:SMC-Scp complex subunit ScpB [Pseudoflavonifractor capillosus]MBM6895940.1 SMC-Scp complex subunit ScpB [Pseudoflavonifractor capillosus]